MRHLFLLILFASLMPFLKAEDGKPSTEKLHGINCNQVFYCVPEKVVYVTREETTESSDEVFILSVKDEPFKFALKDGRLVFNTLSLLGDGTVDYELMHPTYCGKDGKLAGDFFKAQKYVKQWVEYQGGVMLGVESYRTVQTTSNPIANRFSTIWYAKCESFD